MCAAARLVMLVGALTVMEVRGDIGIENIDNKS